MKRFLIALILVVQAHAATVTSITCSGQAATVNATAHGLSASQGFSLSGTAETFNSTVNTATANTFVFVLPAGTLCSGFTSGYTAVQAAKQVIKISSIAYPVGATVAINYLMWFTTSLPNPNAGAVSSWPNASAAENAAIAAGTTVEFVGQLSLPANTTAATAQTSVQTLYTGAQVAFANFLMAGNGYWWNGTAWVNQ